MSDRTTRALLLAIAVGLWAHLIIAALPVSAQAQARSAPPARDVLQAVALDQLTERVKSIDSRTLDMSGQLSDVASDVSSINKSIPLLELEMSRVRDCVKRIGSRLNVGC